MAAAALSRSRAAAGGLYFLLTLLGLVCITSSLIDIKKMENIMESLKKAQQTLHKLKVEKDTPSEQMNKYMRYMEPIMELMKKFYKELPGDYPSVDGLLDNLKSFMEKSKIYIDRMSVEEDAKIAKFEKDLATAENIIKALKGYQAEL